MQTVRPTIQRLDGWYISKSQEIVFNQIIFDTKNLLFFPKYYQKCSLKTAGLYDLFLHLWLKTISWLLEIYHPSKRWMVGRTVCMVHSLTLHLYCPCYCCHSVLWYYVVFLSGSKSEQFFLMVCLYMYCRWRSSCQEGKIRIPLTG
jgi:hypothetical protein